MPEPSWNEAGIPAELRQLAHWLVWRYEQRGDKRTKVPYQARATGQVPASTTDEQSWSDYQAAAAAAPRFDGIGFVFSSEDHYVGIDLDNCRDAETGAVSAWAQQILDTLNSYAEVTPSGRGIHIICRGKLPPGRRREGPIEMYETGRYFTMTGQRLAGTPDPMDRGAVLERLHARLFPTEPEPSHTISKAYNGAAPEDEAIIRMVRRLPAYDGLWRGDFSGYDSHSEADLALCGRIAFFAGPDPALIDRVFRQSGLYRDKWDDPHHGRQGSTYGQDTVTKGLSGKTQFFDWSPRCPVEAVPSVVSVVSVVGRKQLVQPPSQLEPEALYGLPGEVVKAVDPHTESHRAAILASFLVGAGCLLDRGPYVYRDGARHAANEFACLVGLSSKGRKGGATRRTDEIFRSWFSSNNSKYTKLTTCHEEDPWGTLILKGIGSGEAMIEALADPNSDRRRLIFEEEFSRPLKVMRREGSTLSETLRSAWDGSVLSNRTKGKHLVAANNHISIFGHITEDEFRLSLTSAELFNGFANRFLWFCVSRSKPLPFGGGDVPMARIVSRLNEAMEYSRSLSRMEFDAEAAQMWDQGGLYEMLIDRPPGLLGAVTGRAEAHVTRLSLLYAVLDLDREIRAEHLLAGLAVWDFNEKSCAYLFGKSTGDDMADRIEEELTEVYPGGLTRRELRDIFHRNAPKGSIPKALDLLESTGRAEKRLLSTEGRSAELWSLKPSTTNDRNDINDQSPLQRAREIHQ